LKGKRVAMTKFKIGDCVRRKGDGPDKEKLIIRHFAKGDFLAISENGNRVAWLKERDIELIEPAINDLKQAIREVLLSDELLAAFARAWMKTPVLHESDMNLEPTTEQPNESN
jgi:hypothetical protein